MSKSHDIVERLRIRQPLLGTLCDEAADEIERLHGLLRAANQITKEREAEIERLRQEVLTLRGMHQGYRDEIVEHFREIERLNIKIKRKGYDKVT